MSHGNDPLLVIIRNGMDRQPIHQQGCWQAGGRRNLVHWSRLRHVLEEQADIIHIPSLVHQQCQNHPKVNSAVGCLIGLALGDAVGAPLEFMPVTTNKSSDTAVDVTQLDPSTRQLRYTQHATNCFHLEPGQWTDDASMALCLAESMLLCGGYDGTQARIAYYNWWVYGYCNAFRHDPRRRCSVGLGGNIRDSILDVDVQSRRIGTMIPPVYTNGDGKEDAGNGSLMRLAPIAIRYNHQSKERLFQVAELSSRATHPGPDAAWCCQFLSYLCGQAILRRSGDDDNLENDNEGSRPIATFIDATIQSFLDYHHRPEPTPDDSSSSTESLKKLVSLLMCQPLSSKEACWDWKRPQLLIEDTIASRGSCYNGYPVSKEYFGSYCMDGLAMALWAAYRSTGVVDAIGRVVNLLGDCDTTGAICGQIAGAYYGYTSIQSTAVGRQLLDNLHRWDPLWEIEMRAILLFWDGEEE